MCDALRPAISLDVVAATVPSNKPDAVTSVYYCFAVNPTVELAHSYDLQPRVHAQNWHTYQLTRPFTTAARAQTTD